MAVPVLCLSLGGIASGDEQDREVDPSKRLPSKGTAPSSRFTPMAQQYLEAARAKLEQQERAERERRAAEHQRQAQRLALELAEKKAKAKQAQERQAQQQVIVARERQLKNLYQEGLRLFRRGRYAQSIEQLQKLALLDPSHPLVKSAQHLIGRAEIKQLQQKSSLAQAHPGGPAVPDEMVSELEKLLADKRVEQDTLIRHARSAIRDRHHDTAIELLYRVLKQDPTSRQAQVLLEQARKAKLEREEERLAAEIDLEEQEMMNDVLRAEQVPEDSLQRKPRPLPVGAVTAESSTRMHAKLAEPISFDFQEVALADVLDFVADAADVSIIPSPRLDLKTQQVSLRIDKLPLELALKYLMKHQGLAYRIEDGVILIASQEEFSAEPLETRVMFLRSGLGPFALETAAVETNPALIMDPLKDLLEQAIEKPSGSKIVVDERSGCLIVTNTAQNIRKIEQLLSKLDVAPLQVLIETRFVELTMTDLEHLGFESVLNDDVALTKTASKFNTKGPEHQIAKAGGSKFAALSRESEGLNLTLQGVLTDVQFESVLHLLEEQQKSKTLSAPRVTTLNNQSAQIKVVEEFRYPTRYEVSLVQFDVNGDGDFDDAGETEFVNVPQDFQKRDIGILLNVTPSVGKDLKTVTLVLAPEVSQFSQFRDLGGGVTVPEFTTSQLTTSVVMQHGQTVVLGGLMKDTTSETLTKVPVLGDLPLLGNLFRQHEQSQTRKNLIIFVTARVLAPARPVI
jgi:type II secretory pathway component GspD/PulD (secretin)